MSNDKASTDPRGGGNLESNEANASTPEPRVNADRRRLIVAGLVAAPFIMTLAATPARASNAMGSLGGYLGDYGNEDGSLTDGQGLPGDPTGNQLGDRERPFDDVSSTP